MQKEELFAKGRKKENIKNELYAINIVCDNCKKEKVFYIQKGIPVKQHLKNTICEFCKCNIVKDEMRKP